jgi:hypothetical protein
MPASGEHEIQHLSHGALHTDEHGPANHGMSDIQFLYLFDRRHGCDILVCQPVSSVYREALRAPERRGSPKSFQLLSFTGRIGVCVFSSVKLDGIGTQFAGQTNHGLVGIDEQRASDAGFPEPSQYLCKLPLALTVSKIQPALGGYLLPALRDERRLHRPMLESEVDDRVIESQLQIDAGADGPQ